MSSDNGLPRTTIEAGDRNENRATTLRVLRTRGWVVLLCAILGGAAAYGVSRREQKKYTATSSLVFNNQQLSQQVSGVQPINSANPTAAQDTNVRLVQLGNLAQSTAAAIGHKLTAGEVRNSVAVSPQGDTNIVNVSATAASPYLATRIADAYSAQFISQQKAGDQKYIASALAVVEQQLARLSPSQRDGAQGLALQERAQSLSVLGSLQGENVQLAQRAILPTAPSSPKVTRNTVLGIAFGLIVGLGFAFLLERLDRNIRDPHDLQDIYHLPLLGVIPQSTKLTRTLHHLQLDRTGGVEVEAFRTLRAHLRYFNVDRELRTLLVTSAAPGDGKTTIAALLAATEADAGARVVLVEADLRRPTLENVMSLGPSRGLAEVLIGAASIDEVLQTRPVGFTAEDPDEPALLHVMTAGLSPPNPGALIESHAMEKLIEELVRRFDLVVIDTPPVGAVSDAIALMHQVDGVVLVGRLGSDRRDAARRLSEVLGGLDAPLLGVVANGIRGRAAAPYSYGYEGAETPGEVASARARSTEGRRL